MKEKAIFRYLFTIVVALLFATATFGETITYVRKVSTTNFFGWGQAGFYFPQFAATSNVGPKRTDDNMQFYVPNWLEFNFNPWDTGTTFSADKPDCFDNCSGRGVYTRGGYTNWDSFILPNGFSGRSGSIVDEQAENNTNNTVNQIYMKTGVPPSFCMHIVTDNTANAHNSADSIVVRGGRPDQGSFDPRSTVPGPSFDGNTDVHTFRFDNFLPNDFIKIRLNSGTPGMAPGFGGLMFDLTCDTIPNQPCGNNVCDVGLGENCETCPGDCGACTTGTTPNRDFYHHGPNPQSHYVEGSNRLLIFAAHGVDRDNHRVEGVKYGNKNMHFLEARSQYRNTRSIVSVWYLKEADIQSAGGSNFSVDWFHKPGDRSYESIFFTNVSQTFPFGSIDETGCTDCDILACPARPVEPGHISLYTGTHERDGSIFSPLNGYTQDADLWMGGSGKATVGHKNGIGNLESAGAQFGREGAFSLVCFEVQDMPQTDSDGDGLSNAFELEIGTLVNDSDTDSDGVSDYDEVNFDGDATDYNPATDLNPFEVDTDGDGIDDARDQFPLDPTQTGGVLVGDINDDKRLDAVDLLLLQRLLQGEKPANAVEVSADLNIDGVVNALDLLLLQRRVSEYED